MTIFAQMRSPTTKRSISSRCRSIRTAWHILLRFQPVASDLRRVVAAMKLSSNLERMADQATTIARRARKLNQHPPLPEVELIRPMYEQAMSMFKDSVDAFVREDVDLGRAIVPRDEKLDELNRVASRKLNRAHGAGSEINCEVT